MSGPRACPACGETSDTEWWREACEAAWRAAQIARRVTRPVGVVPDLTDTA